MKAVFCTKLPAHIATVYPTEITEEISRCYELDPMILHKKNLNKNMESANQAEAIFSTWGMEHFEPDEIKKYFPRLKYIFYAAGSVQHFAKEFLEQGIRVFAANAANAVPVAEYTFAQILLANKGMFQSIRRNQRTRGSASRYSNACQGNYKPKIGIVGIGQIGTMVVKLLQNVDCQVYYYDPFLSKERAKELGITECDLKDMFKTCDCISNHLANKEELAGILNYDLFSLMKPYATFINTGRGRQVDERGLVRALRQCKTRTALLDVTDPEPPRLFSPMRRMKNIFLTPHIAGSQGGEVARMGYYMMEDSGRIIRGEAPHYEVTADMLKIMA